MEPIRTTATVSQAEQVLQAIRSQVKQPYLSACEVLISPWIAPDEQDRIESVVSSLRGVVQELDAMISKRGGES